MPVLGLESGHFLALRRPQALRFGAFWRPGRAQAKGGCRLREMNRIESGVGLGSGHLESIEWPLEFVF
jgi:hypothetical protein